MGVDQNPTSGSPELTCASLPSEIVEVLLGENDKAETPFQDKNPHSTSGEDAVTDTAGKGFTVLSFTDDTGQDATGGEIEIVTNYGGTKPLENKLDKDQVKIKTIKGFTLIELLVVVAIIGILGAVGTVAYNGYTKGARITAAKNTLMQISLAQTEHFSNAGYYWTNDEACADTYTKAAGKAVNEEVGEGLFTKKNYIDSKIEFYFCVEEPDGGASGFVASAVYKGGSCKLTVDDTSTIDDSSC